MFSLETDPPEKLGTLLHIYIEWWKFICRI